MKYTEYYKCSDCHTTWEHSWDTEDYNNDYTFCPNCLSTIYEEVNYQTYRVNNEI